MEFQAREIGVWIDVINIRSCISLSEALYVKVSLDEAIKKLQRVEELEHAKRLNYEMNKKEQQK